MEFDVMYIIEVDEPELEDEELLEAVMALA